MRFLKKIRLAILGMRIRILSCRIRRRDTRSKIFEIRTKHLISKYYSLKMIRKELKNDE